MNLRNVIEAELVRQSNETEGQDYLFVDAFLDVDGTRKAQIDGFLNITGLAQAIERALAANESARQQWAHDALQERNPT